MLVHASRRQNKSWHWAPIQQKDGFECLKYCRLPPLVGRLARHWDMMQRVWILGCFSGVRVGGQSRWQLDSRLVYGLGTMLSSQAGGICFLISSTATTTNSLNLLRKIQESKSSQDSKEELWAELSLKQILFFSYHLVRFFLLSNGYAIVFRQWWRW